MAFSGEVDNRLRFVLTQQAAHQGAVADIALDENVPGVAQLVQLKGAVTRQINRKERKST